MTSGNNEHTKIVSCVYVGAVYVGVMCVGAVCVDIMCMTSTEITFVSVALY